MWGLRTSRAAPLPATPSRWPRVHGWTGNLDLRHGSQIAFTAGVFLPVPGMPELLPEASLAQVPLPEGPSPLWLGRWGHWGTPDVWVRSRLLRGPFLCCVGLNEGGWCEKRCWMPPEPLHPLAWSGSGWKAEDRQRERRAGVPAAAWVKASAGHWTLGPRNQPFDRERVLALASPHWQFPH